MLGRVDKLNPDSDAGKQHEGGEALDQLVVAGGEPQRAGSYGRVNTNIFLPRGFVAAAMGVAMMAPAQRHGELVADLAP